MTFSLREGAAEVIPSASSGNPTAPIAARPDDVINVLREMGFKVQSPMKAAHHPTTKIKPPNESVQTLFGLGILAVNTKSVRSHPSLPSPASRPSFSRVAFVTHKSVYSSPSRGLRCLWPKRAVCALNGVPN